METATHRHTKDLSDGSVSRTLRHSPRCLLPRNASAMTSMIRCTVAKPISRIPEIRFRMQSLERPGQTVVYVMSETCTIVEDEINKSSPAHLITPNSTRQRWLWP